MSDSQNEQNSVPASETSQHLQRVLALNYWGDFNQVLPRELALLRVELEEKGIDLYRTPESELIERTCTLTFMLMASGAVCVPQPMRILERVRIDVAAARNGFIRWPANPLAKHSALGPRQFLYSSARIHLLAFIKFRLTCKGSLLARDGDPLLPALNKEMISVARADMEWLVHLPRIPKWKAIYETWLEQKLCVRHGGKQSMLNQRRVPAGAVSEISLWQLYRNEPPFLLTFRRGELRSSPLPDSQLTGMLPHKVFNTVNPPRISESSEGNDLIAASWRRRGKSSKEDASNLLRRWINSIDNRELTPKVIAAEARTLQIGAAFSGERHTDLRHLLGFIIARIEEPWAEGQKRVTRSSITTQADRLLRIFDGFIGIPFSSLTTQDMALFLDGYATASAAKNYKSAAKLFHEYLRLKARVKVSPIQWASRSLIFYEGYSERALLTEADFIRLLDATSVFSGLERRQGRVALILLRRGGLRCAEATALKLYDFHGLTECRLNVRTSKTKAGRRTLPLYLLLNGAEYEELLDYVLERKAKGGEHERLLRQSDGSTLAPAKLGSLINRLMQGAGLQGQTAHDLRHSFASSLFAALWLRSTSLLPKSDLNEESAWARRTLLSLGRSDIEGRALNYMDDIRALMGHADIEVTLERYVHILELVCADATWLAQQGGKSEPAFISTLALAKLYGTSSSWIRKKFTRDRRPRQKPSPGKISLADAEQFLAARL